MSEIEVSKSKGEPATGPKDIFSSMRDGMNRVLERFEHQGDPFRGVAEYQR